MKRNVKVFVIGYLLFLVLSVSCGTCNCFTKFNLQSFDWKLNEVALIDGNMEVSPISNNEVNYNKYGINILSNFEYYSNTFHVDLLSKTYACDCEAPTTNDKITGIKIITVSGFDDTHLAGSNVTNYFNISSSDHLELLSIVDYLNIERTFSMNHLLLLQQAPLETGNNSFLVQITLEGKTLDYFEFITNTVNITNN